jgi:hypothetical protein
MEDVAQMYWMITSRAVVLDGLNVVDSLEVARSQ